jgi:hypothetical protein
MREKVAASDIFRGKKASYMQRFVVVLVEIPPSARETITYSNSAYLSLCSKLSSPKTHKLSGKM